MPKESRDKVIEAFIECMSLFHDALFDSDRIAEWRDTQLKKVVDAMEVSKEKKKKLLMEKDIHVLIDQLQFGLKKLYADEFSIDEYNNFVKTGKTISFLAKELNLDEKYFLLTKDVLESNRHKNKSKIKGPQELAVDLIQDANTFDSYRKGFSKTTLLETRKKMKEIYKISGQQVLKLGRPNIRNPMAELLCLVNVFYRAQWFNHPDKELELKMVSKGQSMKKSVFYAELKSSLQLLKSPSIDEKEWINIHDLLIGASFAIDGMLDSNYQNRNINIDFLSRANFVKAVINNDSKSRSSSNLEDESYRTWLSGFYLSNALHRMAWVEERMFFKILLDQCKCQPISKGKRINPHQKLDMCSCAAIRDSLKKIYLHDKYATDFKDGCIKEDFGPLNFIRYLTNKQKHTVDRFESEIGLLGKSKKDHIEIILKGLKTLIEVFNEFGIDRVASKSNIIEK